MTFTSTPQNGSSWQDCLPFAIDTEQEKPLDITLEIANSKELIAQRKIYGVTTTEVDIAPYLRDLSCLPPTINSSATLTPSPSAQTIHLTANGTRSNNVLLFHAPYDNSTPKAISSLHQPREIDSREPIIVTLIANASIQASITFIAPGATNTLTLNAKTQGLPMNLIIPASCYPAAIERIHIEVTGDKKSIANVDYTVVDKGANARCIAWFNKNGGMETYTFPTSIRLSYDAKLSANAPLDEYRPLESSTTRHRLCSAYEVQTEMERLAEMIFSPRIFLVKGDKMVPISLANRHIDFDHHGTLRQMCIEVEDEWKGGAI
jgi:hypothetical protein